MAAPLTLKNGAPLAWRGKSLVEKDGENMNPKPNLYTTDPTEDPYEHGELALAQVFVPMIVAGLFQVHRGPENAFSGFSGPVFSGDQTPEPCQGQDQQLRPQAVAFRLKTATRRAHPLRRDRFARSSLDRIELSGKYLSHHLPAPRVHSQARRTPGSWPKSSVWVGLRPIASDIDCFR